MTLPQWGQYWPAASWTPQLPQLFAPLGIFAPHLGHFILDSSFGLEPVFIAGKSLVHPVSIRCEYRFLMFSVFSMFSAQVHLVSAGKKQTVHLRPSPAHLYPYRKHTTARTKRQVGKPKQDRGKLAQRPSGKILWNGNIFKNLYTCLRFTGWLPLPGQGFILPALPAQVNLAKKIS